VVQKALSVLISFNLMLSPFVQTSLHTIAPSSFVALQERPSKDVFQKIFLTIGHHLPVFELIQTIQDRTVPIEKRVDQVKSFLKQPATDQQIKLISRMEEKIIELRQLPFRKGIFSDDIRIDSIFLKHELELLLQELSENLFIHSVNFILKDSSFIEDNFGQYQKRMADLEKELNAIDTLLDQFLEGMTYSFPESVWRIFDLFKDEDEKIVSSAIKAISKLGLTFLIQDWLIERLENESVALVVGALESLSQLDGLTLPFGKRLFDMLEPKRKNIPLVGTAVEILLEKRVSVSMIKEKLFPWFDLSHAIFAETAISALARVKTRDPEIEKKFIQYLGNGMTDTAALRGLQKIGSTSPKMKEKLFDDILEGKSSATRHIAIDVLTRMELSEEEVKTKIYPLLKYQDYEMRLNALEFLKEPVVPINEIKEKLFPMLDDPNSKIRAEVLEKITHLSLSDVDVSFLKQKLIAIIEAKGWSKQFKAYSSDYVRGQALKVLLGFPYKSSEIKQMQNRMIELLRDRSKYVRQFAMGGGC